MKNAVKTRLIAATAVALCLICSPVVHAEEVPAPPVEITEQSTTTPETPVTTPPVEATEAIPPAEAPEAVEVPAVPALLTERLAPETYAVLTDPNARIVLIDISEQYLWAFENGVAVLESPVISGLANTRCETSRGVFQVEFKKPGKYLRGPEDEDGNPKWNCWVDYWMLFDKSRSIGLHDASWRKLEQYTVETYVTDGSHGCVNLPCEFAPLLYDFVEVGTPVIVQD